MTAQEASGDHPRACGENRAVRERSPRRLGSPPRMRGKHYAMRRCVCDMGITPAHAGKTRMCRNTLPGIRDHPRACGENTIFVFDLDC